MFPPKRLCARVRSNTSLWAATRSGDARPLARLGSGKWPAHQATIFLTGWPDARLNSVIPTRVHSSVVAGGLRFPALHFLDTRNPRVRELVNLAGGDARALWAARESVRELAHAESRSVPRARQLLEDAYFATLADSKS